MIPAWQKRLIDETVELADRINKLNQVMASKEFYSLSREEKTLLYEQQRAMSHYLETLGKRCELYNLQVFDTE